DRSSEQWGKNADRLIGQGPSELLAYLEESAAKLSWWQRRQTAAYRQQVRELVEDLGEQAQAERQAVLDALTSGFGLIQQRLARNMASAGVLRIRALGQAVNPEI